MGLLVAAELTTLAVAALATSPPAHVANTAALGDANAAANADAGEAVLPTARCPITDFGARPLPHGSARYNTAAINRAVASCHAAAPHGAEVIVPPGTFVTGSVNLTSNLTLRLLARATLLSTSDETLYAQVPMLPNESREPVRNQGFISGWGIANTAIVGAGGGLSAIDGNGPAWNNMTHRFAHPFLVNPMHCRGFSVSGVDLRNSAFWTLTPFDCDGVRVSDLSVTADNDAGNTDGIHPDASRNVLVERVTVAVGDDAVAITSGEMFLGRQYGVPSANLTFRDCTFLHRFFAIGSGTAAGVRNVTVDNCTLGAPAGVGHYGPNCDAGINIKTERGNGGWIEDVTFRNVVIHGRVDEWDLLPATPIRVALIYAYNDSIKPPTNCSATPKLRRVSFVNVTATAACEPDYWRPNGVRAPSRCGDNSSVGFGAKARIAPGVFWGLEDSELSEITLQGVHVTTNNPAGAPWRCGRLDTESFRVSDVSPPFDTCVG